MMLKLRQWLLQKPNWQVLLRLPLVAYATLAVYAYWFSDRQIFLPDLAENAPLPVPSAQIPTPDGDRIDVLYLPNPEATHTILYNHGNATTLGDAYRILKELQRRGFNVLAYDYRGYGRSTGKPSEAKSYIDVETTYHYAVAQLKIPADRLIIFGHSVGGGPATYLASRQPVGGLILESTFTSVFRVVVPFPLLPFDKFPNRDRLTQVKVPILIIHGDQDEVIPFRHGEQLFEAAPSPKQFLRVSGAGHDDIHDYVRDFDNTQYYPVLQDFARSLPRSP
jgi:abhydrolase domain-containing protein 17